ncbi:hypothetical protein KIW84_031799 [Lathyrus oleraceus]|uniref:Uncharacterized protein n=1 Tax=Pisum sativum TaxID=3888 RepID=A0A9D5B1C0_PEA|nr:hypothetical protein KIW84_031799 [Pisum sativum]
MEYDVPEKVWEFALKLGISGEISKEVYMEEIRRMKDKDKEESKLSLIDDYVASSFWGSKEMEWYELGVAGASGGIITLWRKILLCLNYSFRGKGYVCVNVAWKGEVYKFVNVYAPVKQLEIGIYGHL